MSSPWAGEDSAPERMYQVIREHRLAAEDRLRIAEAKLEQVQGLLADASRLKTGLSPEECAELAYIVGAP